jgi:hypothetical protein
MHSWSIFGVRTSHKQTWTHKPHHGSNLGEATTFPLILFFMLGHRACTQMSFCPETPKLGFPKFPEIPKILEIGTLTTLEAHSFLCKPLIEMRFEKKL